jgi:hypothetical protein
MRLGIESNRDREEEARERFEGPVQHLVVEAE